MVADVDDSGPFEARRFELLGRLLPGALHELANPLLAMGGTLEFLLDAAEPGTQMRERLEVVEAMAAEIADVVRTLQRLARERVEAEAPIPLAEFVEDTAAVARRFSGFRDVGLDVRAAGSATVDARPAALRLAVLGPVLDALAAAESGGSVELAVEGDRVLLGGAELPLRPLQ